MNKEHTRNQKRMYRIHKQEEKIHDLELLIGTLQQENQKYKEVIDRLTFIKDRARAGATQETINKLAIAFVNNWLKEVE